MKMKWIALTLIFLSLFSCSKAADVTIYFFWGDGCPHCADEKVFLRRIEEEYPGLLIRQFETWYNPKNAMLYSEMAEAYGTAARGVPGLFIGEDFIIGYRSDETTGEEIREKIEYCMENGCRDPYDIMGSNGASGEESGFEETISPAKVVSVNLFIDSGCGSCLGVKDFAEGLAREHNVEINVYDITNKSEERIYEVFKKTYSAPDAGFPVIFVGERFLLGRTAIFDNLHSEMDRCAEEGCPIPEEKIKGLMPYVPSMGDLTPEKNIIELPLFGRIDVSEVGLFAFSAMVGLLDGFNACAMWVLCFLLTLLVYSGSRKRVLLIGGTFILVSGIVYFLFISALMNLFLFVGYLGIIRAIIGIVAIIFGIINVKDFFAFGRGFSLMISKERKKKIIEKMRAVLKPEISLPATVAGVVLLALGVNMIELLCTVGFPAIYTGIMASQNISVLTYYFYLFVYISFYMLDDLVLFAIITTTMTSKRFTEKYGKVSKFISGVVILALGLIMILKPELLVFN